MNSILLQAGSGGNFLYFLFTLAFAIIIFLVFRGIMLWYWRVNEIVNNQQRQIEQQRIIIEGLGGLYKLLQNKRKGTTEKGGDMGSTSTNKA